MTDRLGNIRDFRIKQQYYNWLLGLINADSPNYDSYNLLLRKLHRIKFYSKIQEDKNREADAYALREEFKKDYGDEFTNFSKIDSPDCSVLEVLVALACAIDSDVMCDPRERRGVPYWFWKMISNLGLWDASDDRFGLDGSLYVDDTIERFLDRAYKRNGVGGLFPLRLSKKDQRKVEIWYQMHSYLNENYPIS